MFVSAYSSSLLFESLVLFDLPHEYFNGILTFLGLLGALTPVIPKRKGKHGSVLEVVSCRDRPRRGLSALELTFGVFVPKIVAAILSVCCKRVELLVEWKSIDRVYLGAGGVVVSVAFEAEIISEVCLVFVKVDILDSASTLNWAYRITFSVRKALDACCCTS